MSQPIWEFEGPYSKDYSILGSILGSPYFGKLPFVLGVLHFGVLRNYLILSALNLPQMSLAKRAVPPLVVKYRAQKDRRATVNSIAIRARMTFTCGDHGPKP